ncbi:hypothetical protein PYCC9005_004756 [Savitreella phatthalungensis]
MHAALFFVSAAAAVSVGSAKRDTTTTMPVAGYSAIGCYKDTYPTRALDGASYSISNYNTVEHCNVFCSDRGYTYAGTEFSSECYCGNTLPEPADDQSQCNFPCGGDSSEVCGGDNKLSIQQISYSYQYGCSVDDINYRSLNGASTSSDSMTNSLCSEFCGAQGFALYGTEYGRECYCGNALRLSGSATCNTPCAGNTNEICGGNLALSVYTTNMQSSPSGSSYQALNSGCFADYYPNSRALAAANTESSDMTVEKCAAFCDSTGAGYFGVEYSTQCFCGTSQPTEVSSSCNMACGGNAAETCGGSNALNVYYYPSKATPSSGTAQTRFRTFSNETRRF